MTFVDTAFLITVCHSRDLYHQRAKLWAARLQGTFLTTDFVLWEVANFFSAPSNRRKAIELVRMVQTTPKFRVIPATASLFQLGMAEFERADDKGWSLTDCASFVTMREHAVTRALTSDHHFEQAGFEALLLADPLDVDSES